ncbi:MAG: hypothetical protein ACE14U_02620 [Candidatus Velamenicoccus archaeovorus]
MGAKRSNTTAGLTGGQRSCDFPALSRRGQQIAEYALVMAALASALLMMYVYTKRGIQSTIKDLTDHEIGWQNDSVPILAAGVHQNTTAAMTTKAQDAVRVRKDSGLGAQYDFASASRSTGESNVTFNEL